MTGITLSNDESLEFKPGLPPQYAGPVLRGAQCYHAKSNIASVVFQEFMGELYAIRYGWGRFLDRVTARTMMSHKGLYSYFMLKSGMRKRIDTAGGMHLRQDHYAGVYTSVPASCSASFDKTNDFRVMGVFYTPRLLEELVSFFPEVEKLLGSSGTVFLNERICWTLPSMKEICNQLLNCNFDASTSRFYFDLKVRELLYQMLEQQFRKGETHHIFTPWEQSKIHHAKQILSEYISSRPPSVRELSKMVALNEFKLKVGFKQSFNCGIFEWLLEERMQHARELVLTTNKPIKEICVLVGYPRTSNFITAFRRRFGTSPGSLRRI